MSREGAEEEVNGREMSQFYKTYKGALLCVYLSAQMSVCMCACGRVFEIILSYWAINQPYSHLSITFSKCYAHNAKLKQGQRDTDTTKKVSLARKIPPFVSLTIQV